MQYYSCKCGKKVIWSKVSIPKCIGCDKCETTLEVDTELCTPIQPHRFKIKFTQAGDKVRVCNQCFLKKNK